MQFEKPKVDWAWQRCVPHLFRVTRTRQASATHASLGTWYSTCMKAASGAVIACKLPVRAMGRVPGFKVPEPDC